MNRIIPELFSSSWFLTAFAFKLNNLEVVYELWEEMIKQSDPLFLVYVSVAFLQHVTHLIIDKEDYLVAQAISKLTFDSLEELHMILPKAIFIKKNMPYSIFVRLINFNIYNLETINSSIKALENEFCLIVPPQEVMIRAYPDTKICICKYKKCAWCTKRSKDLPLIILDCRQGNEQNYGVFPNTSLIDPVIYKDLQSILDFPDQFAEIRGNFHFCLMGSREFTIETFDIQEKASLDSDKTRMVIENLLQAFLVKGFPYVSLVEGGYQKCHDFALNFNLLLDSHNPDYCPLCNPKGLKLKCIIKKKLKLDQIEPYSYRQTKDRSNSVGDCQIYEANNVDTGYYKCRKYNKRTRELSTEYYEIAINKTFFTVGIVKDYGGDSKTILYHGKLESLYKIQTKNKQNRIVGFYFIDYQNSLFFEFETLSDARTCIAQATKFVI